MTDKKKGVAIQITIIVLRTVRNVFRNSLHNWRAILKRKYLNYRGSLISGVSIKWLMDLSDSLHH